MISEEVMLKYVRDSHQCASVDGILFEYAIDICPVARYLFGKPDNSSVLLFQLLSDSFSDVHSHARLMPIGSRIQRFL